MRAEPDAAEDIFDADTADFVRPDRSRSQCRQSRDDKEIHAGEPDQVLHQPIGHAGRRLAFGEVREGRTAIEGCCTDQSPALRPLADGRAAPRGLDAGGLRRDRSMRFAASSRTAWYKSSVSFEGGKSKCLQRLTASFVFPDGLRPISDLISTYGLRTAASCVGSKTMSLRAAASAEEAPAPWRAARFLLQILAADRRTGRVPTQATDRGGRIHPYRLTAAPDDPGSHDVDPAKGGTRGVPFPVDLDQTGTWRLKSPFQFGKSVTQAHARLGISRQAQSNPMRRLRETHLR